MYILCINICGSVVWVLSILDLSILKVDAPPTDTCTRKYVDQRAHSECKNDIFFKEWRSLMLC